MTPKKMSVPKMQTVGHYRPRRRFSVPGQMNAPRRGRPSKRLPSFKKLTPRPRRGR